MRPGIIYATEKGEYGVKRTAKLSCRLIVALALIGNGQIGIAEECTPSRWGADDEIGAANHVSPEQVLMAAKLVKKGQSHPLAFVDEVRRPDRSLQHLGCCESRWSMDRKSEGSQ